jgi:hypothetical protein
MIKLLTKAPEIRTETFWNDESIKATPKSESPTEKTQYTGSCKWNEFFEEDQRPLIYCEDTPDINSNGCLDIEDWNDIFNTSSNYLNNEDNIGVPNYFNLFQEKNY